MKKALYQLSIYILSTYYNGKYKYCVIYYWVLILSIKFQVLICFKFLFFISIWLAELADLLSCYVPSIYPIVTAKVSAYRYSEIVYSNLFHVSHCIILGFKYIDFFLAKAFYFLWGKQA